MDPLYESLVQQTIDQFWSVFPSVWHNIHHHLREIVEEDFNVTVEQFHILRNIYRGTDFVSKLAAEKRISRPAISQSVDVLVNKGLITRRENADDRRYVQLELTENGRILIEEVFNKNRYWMREKFAVLNEGEINHILQGMEALHKAFSESDD